MNKTAETLEELQAQLVAVQQSVVHGLCANSEPCAVFCEAIATRKMFKQMQAERDNAWRELREIREALKANPEESTADEVRAMVKRCQTLHSLMVSGEQRGVAKATEELSVMAADAFGDGYFEGFIDGGKRQEQEDLNLKSDGGLARFSDYALRASEVAEGVKAERLGLSPRKQRQFSLPDFLMSLSKSLNETPHCVRALSWHDDKTLQDWIKSLTAKVVSDENN